jgi:basic amino acid/polyamine antiporter, APA family
MAEETKQPTRLVPTGIVAAVVASTALYVLIAAAVVLAGSAGENPSIALFEGAQAKVFAAVGFISIANGVFVEIMMMSRLFYGMARNRLLPQALACVHSRTRTPGPATAIAGGLVLAVALLVPFNALLVATNAVILVVFVMVDISLRGREQTSAGRAARRSRARQRLLLIRRCRAHPRRR